MPKRIKRPFLLFSLVCLASDVLMMLTNTDYIILPLILCSIGCLTLCLRASDGAKHFLVAASAVVMSAILFSLNLGLPAAYEQLSLKNAEVSGTVYEVKPETENSFAYILKDYTVNEKPYSGYLRLYSTVYTPALPGDRIEFTASEIFSQKYEGIYRYHSLSARTYLTAFCRENPQITQEADKKDIISAINRLKLSVTQKFFENMPYTEAAVATALITGSKDYIPDDISLSFRISGISHIFAVSGMHLSIWTGLFFIIFKQRARSARLPNIAAIIFVVFFCIFTGFSPSVLRSGIMLVTFFAAKLFRRQADGLNSLGIAGSALLLINPFLAGNVSFLLSFAATFALIWFSEFIFPQIFTRNRKKAFSFTNLIKKSANAIAISFAAMLMTLPITAVFFGYISLLSPIAGLIVTPLAEAVMLSSFIAAIIPSGNILSFAVFSIARLAASAITAVTGFFATLDEAVLSTQPLIIIPWFTLSVIALCTVYIKTKNKKNLLICVLASVFILLSTTALHTSVHRNDTKIYIPGASNATCVTLVSASGREALIYGTGGDYSTTNKTTAYLNSAGVMTADILMIPRDKKTENNNTSVYLEKLFPEEIIRIYDDTNNGIYEASFGIFQFYSKSTDDFCATAITADGIKIVICSLPYSDFSQTDPIFTSADILICRNALPRNINTESFKEIIIMSDSPYKDARADISTFEGDIEITLKGDSYALSR